MINYLRPKLNLAALHAFLAALILVPSACTELKRKLRTPIFVPPAPEVEPSPSNNGTKSGTNKTPTAEDKSIPIPDQARNIDPRFDGQWKLIDWGCQNHAQEAPSLKQYREQLTQGLMVESLRMNGKQAHLTMKMGSTSQDGLFTGCSFDQDISLVPQSSQLFLVTMEPMVVTHHNTNPASCTAGTSTRQTQAMRIVLSDADGSLMWNWGNDASYCTSGEVLRIYRK